jgi:hypothetical protein
VALVVGFSLYFARSSPDAPSADPAVPRGYLPRQRIDSSGFVTVITRIPEWPGTHSTEQIATAWKNIGGRLLGALEPEIEFQRAAHERPRDKLAEALLQKAALLNYEGDPKRAYGVLEELRELVRTDPNLNADLLYTVIYFQGVTALRCGETDNCVLCRGESSCILPISPAAVHTNRTGSQLAIRHLTEYLSQFPNDLEVRWLLNVAHMTLGEYPAKVDPKYLVSLDRFNRSEFGIGKFRDVGHLVGINRLNLAGGAIMDDFDNDGRFDLAFTSWDPTQSMALFRNKGDGTFEDRTAAAGLEHQVGGANAVQTDFNNDGLLDILITRGGWANSPMHLSLLRNNDDGTFTDVTKQAGLDDPVNTMAAAWADFDNDGFLDVFVACERQPNRLYRNRGDGTFEEVAARAGVAGKRSKCCKGATWIDFDNDGFPDLFVSDLNGTAALYRNNRNGTFSEVTIEMGINGPTAGFSCWAWDYDNDGWPDIFATCFDRTVEDVVLGLTGQPHRRYSNKLFRNVQGKGFKDVTVEAGLDLVFSTMGSNFGDFDNDGFLDMYLGTGDPNLSTLVPNRMFRNLAGKRFAEITSSSGTGHLQKGHGVACGDWDRDGNVDIAIQLGGATPGDRYHNALFQNPGQGNSSISVKLVGKRTNRAAIGARIKAVTAGEHPLTVYRHVSSGSSFGANPLEQTIGLGKADRIAVLEIEWPTSGTKQTFRDVAANQCIEITEFATEYRKREIPRVPLPK